MLADVADALQKFQSSARLDDLAPSARDIFGSYGFDSFLSFVFIAGENVEPSIVLGGNDESAAAGKGRKPVFPYPSIGRKMLETDKPFPISERNCAYQLAIPVQAHDSLRGGILLSRGENGAKPNSMEELQFVAMALFAAMHKFVAAGQSPLTKRELEMLSWAAEGKTTDEIANILNVTPRTVNTHFENASRKLGNTNRLGTVVKAMRMGLIS